MTARLLSLAVAVPVAAEDIARPVVPSIDGEWRRITSNPDLGPLTGAKQQPVDFAVWRDEGGTWRLRSCIRGTKCGGKTRLLFEWTSPKLTDPNWKPAGIVMQADPKLGETEGGLQAPFVFIDIDRYRMLYGDWVHICLAGSDDGGRTFNRVPVPNADLPRTGRFGEGPADNARDPMAIRIGDRWHVYYTAHPANHGSVYCRTTKDFVTFSDATIVASGGKAGDGPYAAECPHVVKRGDSFYLFRTSSYSPKPRTHVYASRDPMRFGIDGDDSKYVAEVPFAAPEIVRVDGQDYVVALTPELDGMRVTKLKWVEGK
jgi:hypothetical protein